MYTGFWFKPCLSRSSSKYRGCVITTLVLRWKFKSSICHSEGTNVTVRIKRSEMRLRLDSYVATMLLLWMTKGWGHPHPNGIMTIGIFEYSITQTKFGYHRAICTISSQRDIIDKGDIIVISLRQSRNITLIVYDSCTYIKKLIKEIHRALCASGERVCARTRLFLLYILCII